MGPMALAVEQGRGKEVAGPHLLGERGVGNRWWEERGGKAKFKHSWKTDGQRSLVVRGRPTITGLRSRFRIAC